MSFPGRWWHKPTAKDGEMRYRAHVVYIHLSERDEMEVDHDTIATMCAVGSYATFIYDRSPIVRSTLYYIHSILDVVG